MVIVSDSTKQLIILELSVPWGECMDEANERKCGKYQEQVDDCNREGWIIQCEYLVASLGLGNGMNLSTINNRLGPSTTII